MKKVLSITLSALLLALANAPYANACTGIQITAADGTKVLARTIEWKGGNLNSKLIIMPRGQKNTALTPDGKNGHTWTSKYGAVGASTVQPEFVAEGVNEKGIDVATGKSLVEVDPRYFRPAEVEQLLGDPTKAKTQLGWNPRKTSFEELVRIMVEHDMKKVRKMYLRDKMED